MQIVYLDNDIVVCVKPAGVLSTDEPGGLPELVRAELGNPKADIRTVHRLDRVVSGLMVLARNAACASALSAQIRAGSFGKEYLAVVHGRADEAGTLRDLIVRDRAERKSYVTDKPGKYAREAVLDYRSLGFEQGLSKLSIILRTGRTHQIRCQFSSRNLPIVGDRKYSLLEDGCDIALWSCALSFAHPVTGESMNFRLPPPDIWPWTLFEN
ncbi:MAG: RluA family pseudouridine synthase [Candidatus Limivicinus sp.]|jgi:23S rRNA pseudouridine1911/1915/1917 synthase